MKAFDAATASPFHVDWLVPLDQVTEDDYARAVAEKADVLLRSAQFLDLQRQTASADLEVRVWIEAACGPACVAITYEPGVRRHGFYLLDDSLRERLGCVVFDDVPSVSGAQSEAQADLVLDATLRALREAQAETGEPGAWADAIRDAGKSVRVRVQDGARPERGEK